MPELWIVTATLVILFMMGIINPLAVLITTLLAIWAGWQIVEGMR